MLNIEKHRNVLVPLLKDIAGDKIIGQLLGFKGGTAAYLFYHLPRFSVDLDFDLLEELDGEMQETVLTRVATIAKQYGTIRESHNKRYILFILLDHQAQERNIKIKVSKRPVPSRYKVQSYLGISARVMAREDMAASKMAALIGRALVAHRDVYDVWYFLKNNWEVNEKLAERITGRTYRQVVQHCISRVGRIDSRFILQGLGDLLDDKQKQWAREHLKEDTLFLLKFRLRDEMHA